MIKIIENNSELGAGTRGASLGVNALKVVSRTKEDQFFSQFKIDEIALENQMLDLPTNFPFAKRIDGIVKIFGRTMDAVKQASLDGDFPLVLSGDHSSAGGTIAGIKAAFPNKRLGVVWIDAHADLHTPYTTPSGNVHGMPLATALAADNVDFQINEVKDETLAHWESLKNMGGIAPKVNPEDLIFIAVRDTEAPEDAFLKAQNIRNFTVEEIRDKSKEWVAGQVENLLKDCDIIYISFDVDSMDSILVSKGTGTPVENGLTPEEANYFVNHFAALEKVKCVEFVEINPCLDDKINKMAETAYPILQSVCETLNNRL
ncbi:arginase [Putridiphycobacter roseus]|uniref:Arginase n=1 Tax=Putridiphycobacter roseus TaxID=2219161 RepID=A0A2W1N0A4_9FLAO|nr:arginase [Putridiphycobacter roseus]PZE17637.1 arginase [Putridiphycobacter roseus]